MYGGGFVPVGHTYYKSVLTEINKKVTSSDCTKEDDTYLAF